MSCIELYMYFFSSVCILCVFRLLMYVFTSLNVFGHVHGSDSYSLHQTTDVQFYLQPFH